MGGRRRALAAVGGALVLSALAACRCGSVCGPGTCSGCCDGRGICLPGAAVDACGTAGGLCEPCQAASSESCVAGACVVPFDDYAGEAWRASCAWAVRCDGFPPADHDWCVSSGLRAHDGTLAALVDAGTVAYSPPAAAECLRYARQADCRAATRVSSACENVFRPAVASGAPCLQPGSSFECQSPGETCAGPACQLACQPVGGLGQPCLDSVWARSCVRGLVCAADGRCREPPDLGEPCSVSTGCARGAWCDAGRCDSAPGLGEPCFLDAGAACAALAVCAADGGVCIARGGPGERCDAALMSWYDNPCLDGLACAAGVCVVPLDAGAACALTDACRGAASCDLVSRTCMVSTLVDEGEPCSGDDEWLGTQRCRPGLRCSGLEVRVDGPGSFGECRRPRTGDVCQSHRDCGTAHFCGGLSGLGGLCAPAALGTPCDWSYNCRPGAVCVAGLCRAAAARGAPCADSSECAQGLWCAPAEPDGGALVCRGYSAIGEACDGEVIDWLAGSSTAPCAAYEVACLGGRCTVAVPLDGGQPCRGDRDCPGGRCATALAAPVCEPRPVAQPEGDPCRSGAECASARCVALACAASCP